jgi:hypothetical protein
MMARMDAGAAPLPSAPLQLRFARGFLVLLALLLPFEVPLFRLGPLQLTTVELVLYAMLMGWGMVLAFDFFGGRLSARSGVAALREEPIVLASVVWTVVVFASAVHAPSYRTEAIKFALRSLSGVLAFFATQRLARSPEIARRVLWALVAGALLSAAAAAIEWLVPRSAVLWRPFREHDFDTLGLARASGTFAYPTIGAMYWEAAVPLLVVAPFLGDTARRKEGAARSSASESAGASMRGALVAILGSTLLFFAILASATRSGLAGAAIACAALLWLGRQSGVWMRRAVVGVLVTSAAIALLATGWQSLLGQRLRWWRDGRWFGVEYRVETTSRAAAVGEEFSVPVTLRNTGTLTWSQGGAHPTHLSYHWEPLSGARARPQYEGVRTDLPNDVPAGGVLEVVATVRGPDTEGTYLLRWDLVQEQVTWFSDQGNRMPSQRVDVRTRTQKDDTSRAAIAETAETGAAPPLVDPPLPSRPMLWRAAITLWRERPLLGIGPDNFRRRYQAVLSPSPTGQPYTDTRIHANSFYFETLADLGLFGLGALVAMAIAIVRVVRRHYETGYLVGLAAGVAASAFFVHGLLDYFLEFTPLFGLFWLLLGLTAAGDVRQRSSGQEPSPLARSPSTKT